MKLVEPNSPEKCVDGESQVLDDATIILNYYNDDETYIY